MELLPGIKVTASHSDHDPRWLIIPVDLDSRSGQGQSAPEPTSSCLACIVELLEDHTLLLVKKRLLLAEMLRLLGYHGNQMQELLGEDSRVTAHVALTLVGLYHSAYHE